MPKRRDPKAINMPSYFPSKEEVERFAAAADDIKPKIIQKEPFLDPDANRDFKAIRVPFNEYEFNKLERAVKKTGRTKLNYIRWAIMKAAEEL